MSRSRKEYIRELAEESSRNGKNNQSDKKYNTDDLLKGSHVIIKKIDDNESINDDLSLSDETDMSDDESTHQSNHQTKKKNETIPIEFKEKVTLYAKIDDMIRAKQDELKSLKEQRKPYEEYILSYLEKKDIPCVNIASGKLIKNKAESTAALKLDIIKESIIEGIKSEKDLSNPNEVKCRDVSEKIIDIMNNKRQKTIRVNLKRTFHRDKGDKNNKKEKAKK